MESFLLLHLEGINVSELHRALKEKKMIKGKLQRVSERSKYEDVRESYELGGKKMP